MKPGGAVSPGLLSSMPGLMAVPILDIARDAVALLNFALQLIALLIKIIVGEFASLLLDLAFHLFPVSARFQSTRSSPCAMDSVPQ